MGQPNALRILAVVCAVGLSGCALYAPTYIACDHDSDCPTDYHCAAIGYCAAGQPVAQPGTDAGVEFDGGGAGDAGPVVAPDAGPVDAGPFSPAALGLTCSMASDCAASNGAVCFKSRYDVAASTCTLQCTTSADCPTGVTCCQQWGVCVYGPFIAGMCSGMTCSGVGVNDGACTDDTSCGAQYGCGLDVCVSGQCGEDAVQTGKICTLAQCMAGGCTGAQTGNACTCAGSSTLAMTASPVGCK